MRRAVWFLFSAILCACSDGGNGTGDQTASIGPEGGTVSVNGFTLEVPPGALDTTIEFEAEIIDEATLPAPFPEDSFVAFRLGPAGTTFNSPVRLTIPASPGLVVGAEIEILFYDQEDFVVVLTGSVVDAVTIEVELDYFGYRPNDEDPELASTPLLPAVGVARDALTRPSTSRPLLAPYDSIGADGVRRTKAQRDGNAAFREEGVTNSGPRMGEIIFGDRNQLHFFQEDDEVTRTVRVGNEKWRVTLDDTTTLLFKNEEEMQKPSYVTNDFYMAPCVARPLKGLARSVRAVFGPRWELRVTEAYDAHEETGAAIHKGPMHYDGRAVDLTVANRDNADVRREHFSLLAWLAHEAGFSWVLYEGNHVHASCRGWGMTWYETAPGGRRQRHASCPVYHGFDDPPIDFCPPDGCVEFAGDWVDLAGLGVTSKGNPPGGFLEDRGPWLEIHLNRGEGPSTDYYPAGSFDAPFSIVSLWNGASEDWSTCANTCAAGPGGVSFSVTHPAATRTVCYGSFLFRTVSYDFAGTNLIEGAFRFDLPFSPEQD